MKHASTVGRTSCKAEAPRFRRKPESAIGDEPVARRMKVLGLQERAATVGQRWSVLRLRRAQDERKHLHPQVMVVSSQGRTPLLSSE